MAQYMFQELVNQKGCPNDFYINSGATSSEEIGSPIHFGAKKKLNDMGVPIGDHVATRIRKEDYEKYDYLIGMDHWNFYDMKRLFEDDPENKVYKMMSFVESDEDVDDPWWSGDFDTTYQDLSIALNGLWNYIQEKK